MNEQKIFAKGYCFAKIFILFVLGCIVGTYYEQVLTLIVEGRWVSRSGLLYGPFNPIYGLGFIMFIIFLHNSYLSKPRWLNFLYCCLIGGGVEYVTNWVQEVIFQSESWNYSNHFLNIHGRTTILFMLAWGIGGMVIVYIIYPFLSKWIEKFPIRYAKFLYPALVIFIFTNMILSYTALYRFGTRQANKPATNIIEELCDTYYPDDVMQNVYENLEILTE